MNEYLEHRAQPLVCWRPSPSSLTELFSRDLITLRMEKLRQHYPWLSGGLDYFEARLYQAPEDSQFAIELCVDNAKTRAEQELAIQALRDKCDILWAQLDALYFVYVQPGWPPPGAFMIEGSVDDGGTGEFCKPRLAAGCRWGAATRSGPEEVRMHTVSRRRNQAPRHGTASAGTAAMARALSVTSSGVAETVWGGRPGQNSERHQPVPGAIQRKRIVDY